MTHLPWTVALYRLALHVYPAAFRRSFGAELVRDMELATGERWQAEGWPGLVGLWGRTLADLAVSAAGMPPSASDPRLGSSSPTTRLTVVLLPEPFGPR